VRVFRLGEEPGDNLDRSTTPEERLAMMWPLTLAAWALTGKKIPDYDRRTMPVRHFAEGQGNP
jgi:DMSO/TMAO reductase YedYZ molybdopterin-dependent catalytic subunit